MMGQKYEDIKNSIGGQEDLTEEQRVNYYKKVNGFTEMMNRYEVSPDERLEMIQKYGVEAFETNLDTLVMKYSFDAIRKKHFNNVLPNIHALLCGMKFHAWKTGNTEEMNKALEDMYKQLKVSVYGTSVLEGTELEHTLAVIKKFQKIASVMAITLRPALLIKELVVGTIKNTSFA